MVSGDVMTAARSVLVIGGGIVGLSSALALRERGFDVTLLDDAPERPCASWGNIGHIATEQVEPLASWRMTMQMPRRLMSIGGPVSFPPSAIATWLPFGLRLLAAGTPSRFARGKAALSALLEQALPAWRIRVATIGATDLLRETGHIVAWERAASATRGRRALARPAASAAVSCHDLTDEQGELLRATISRPIIDAMRYEGTASIADPGSALDALRTAFLAMGGRLETGMAGREHVTGPATDLVVVAAGVRSKRLMEALGHRVPIIAERGYHIQSPSAHWPAGLPPIVFEDRALVVSGFTSGLRATSFVEFTRHDAPPDPRKWARLRRHVQDLGLSFGDDTATWYGSRPTLPDYLPAIGRSTRNPRILYAFGHQHLGLTLGPMTGVIIAALATGERSPVDLSAFAVDRFAAAF
ncbi:MAG: FAD-dependent oxidoreductase [Proteobacteria bacterium]|nr:FAD-dependent oxidoreductase [Pseudomonadota bacterium]